MRIPPSVRRSLIALLVVFFVALAAILVQGLYLKASAKRLAVDLASLTTGAANYADAERLSLKYKTFRVPAEASFYSLDGGRLDLTPEDRCTQQRCGIEFVVTNGLSGRLHLVPPSFFRAIVVVLSGRVVYVEMELNNTTGAAAYVRYVDCCSPEASVFRWSQHPYSVYGPIEKHVLHVSFTNAATKEERGHALAFTTHCLFANFGCKHPAEILPLAWKDYIGGKSRQLR